MLTDVKEKLITNVDSLIGLLEYFGFEKISLRVSEIRFARDQEGGANNIQIKLDNNDGIYVRDYARNIKADIISYIMQERDVDFKTVVDAIKKILGLSDVWQEQKKLTVFGGIYDNIGIKREAVIKTYPDSIMDRYEDVGNELWVKDGIHIETQKYFGVRFDVTTNGIVFPWRNDMGQIIAIKSRYNGVPDEDQPKYYYPVRGNISYALYGFSENYGDLYKSDRIYVFESEKSVMKMHEFGYGNCVALGSHSLSTTQASLILQLRPSEVIFMLDKDLDYDETVKNAEVLKTYTAFSDITIKMWGWKQNDTLPGKSSPCDGTKEQLQYILNNEIIDIKNLL